MAEEASEAAFDLVAHLATHGPTLREAIELCVQFQRLLMDGASLTMHETGTSATIRCDFPRTSPRADRMLSELAMAGLLRLIRGFAGPDAKVSAVCFEHERPKGEARAIYARIFGGREKWQQPHTTLSIPRSLLDKKPLHDHPELYAVLHAQAEAKLDRMERGEGIAEKVKRHLLAMPPSRIPDMDVIARLLSLSERSLRRKLAAEGVIYKDLRESVLESRAIEMLKDDARSPKEIADALGFSDTAAFQRAFKRWRGMTPRQFKQSK
jgi:AraC-like DNA-binding protein